MWFFLLLHLKLQFAITKSTSRFQSKTAIATLRYFCYELLKGTFPKKKQIPWLVSAMYVRLLGGQGVDVV